MPGPQLLDMGARSSMTAAKVLAKKAPVDTPSLMLLLPNDTPGLVEPFEDMLPARPEEEQDDDEEDLEDAEEETARAVAVFESSLKAIAKDLKLDFWGDEESEDDADATRAVDTDAPSRLQSSDTAT